MADRFDNLQFDHFTSKQTQSPFAIACRWRTEPHGDHLRFLAAIEQFLRPGGRGFLAVQSLLKAEFDKSLPDILDGLRAAGKSLSNSGVRPRRAIRIGL